MTRRQVITGALLMSIAWTLLHAYVWTRLFGTLPTMMDAPLPGVLATWQSASMILMLLLALLPFAAVFGGRRRGMSALMTGGLAWGGFTALALSSLLLVLSVAADVLFLRVFLEVHVVTLLVLAMASVLVAVGAWGAHRPRVRTVTVPIADLTPSLDGFRIVQLSDLHVGGTLRRRFVERVVETVNGLAPDVIALTGDIADAFPSAARHIVAPLAHLQATHGKFFVTGNHEYYWDAVGWLDEVERLGFATLVNTHRLIEHGQARLLVAGVTDHFAGGAHRSSPIAAMAGAPDAHVRVLLAHQPVSVFAAKDLGFHLQLSGHTHGGQYFPFSWLIRMFQPFVAGLHLVENGWLYVSRGTGYWGPPVRLGAPPEITLLELRPAGQPV